MNWDLRETLFDAKREFSISHGSIRSLWTNYYFRSPNCPDKNATFVRVFRKPLIRLRAISSRHFATRNFKSDGWKCFSAPIPNGLKIRTLTAPRFTEINKTEIVKTVPNKRESYANEIFKGHNRGAGIVEPPNLSTSFRACTFRDFPLFFVPHIPIGL